MVNDNDVAGTTTRAWRSHEMVAANTNADGSRTPYGTPILSVSSGSTVERENRQEVNITASGGRQLRHSLTALETREAEHIKVTEAQWLMPRHLRLSRPGVVKSNQNSITTCRWLVQVLEREHSTKQNRRLNKWWPHRNR